MDGISYLYGGIDYIGQLHKRQGMGQLVDRMSSERPPATEELKDTSFGDLVISGIGEVNMMQMKADEAVEKMMTGGEIGMAEVLTAVQKADIAFKMLMQMRNKFVNAYQEIQGIRV